MSLGRRYVRTGRRNAHTGPRNARPDRRNARPNRCNPSMLSIWPPYCSTRCNALLFVVMLVHFTLTVSFSVVNRMYDLKFTTILQVPSKLFSLRLLFSSSIVFFVSVPLLVSVVMLLLWLQLYMGFSRWSPCFIFTATVSYYFCVSLYSPLLNANCWIFLVHKSSCYSHKPADSDVKPSSY